MATFTDTFTDTSGTAITAHTADTGESWAFPSWATSKNLDIESNELRCDDNSANADIDATTVLTDWSPPSADYFVEFDMNFGTVASFNKGIVVGRAASGAETAYFLYLEMSGTDRLLLKKVVGGSITQLDSFDTGTLVTATTYTLKLEMIGTAIKGYLDGIERVGDVDPDISGAGAAGIAFRSNNNTGFVRIESITADDLAAPAAAPNTLTLLGVG